MFEEENSLVKAESVERNPYKILLKSKRGRSFSEPPSSVAPEINKDESDTQKISPRSLKKAYDLVDTGIVIPRRADVAKAITDSSEEQPAETIPRMSI